MELELELLTNAWDNYKKHAGFLGCEDAKTKEETQIEEALQKLIGYAEKPPVENPTRIDYRACDNYVENPFVCDDTGEPKGQCVNCGYKWFEHIGQRAGK